ncbi:MAG: radical SAM protein [Methanocellales archaeon]|nr:radical SAM protein [Methanocellales archaeon]MDI6902227.1 radical SAM protein [Methanocellales archaeon]
MKNETNVYHITYYTADKSASIFFWGCNFSCKGCIRKLDVLDYHLKDTDKKSKKVVFLDFEEIIKRVIPLEPKRVVFRGWEPTLDPDLPKLAASFHDEFKTWNYLTTNGFTIPSLNDVDEIEISIKAYSDEIHRDYTGKSNKRVLDNFINVYEMDVKLRAETILIPNYIDSQEIELIARFISRVDPAIPFRIDGYVPIPGTPWRPPTQEEMDGAVDAARKYLKNVSRLDGSVSFKGEVLKIV